MAIKVETSQGHVKIEDLAIRDKTPAVQEADKFLEHLKTELVQEDFPPTPKRRRTVKEEDREALQEDDDHEEVTIVKAEATATIPTSERKKATPKPKKTPAKKESSDEKSTPTKARGNSESKRGPKMSFTAEQDAYIAVLRQSTNNATEVWKKFEEKFNTGKNEKAIKNRWFAIKDNVLLSGEQERLLMEIIEEVQGDIAASIVDKFAGRAEGCKVTKAYVQKKMKELQEQPGKGNKKGEKTLKEE